ncbi:MAG: hypothetical protein Q7J31_19680, partial [Syntrophales bacterium]|nr:hypothetical protein [Syntrophales bacterium]
GDGFFMHRQEVKQDARQPLAKDEQNHNHEGRTSAVASEDKDTGAHQHMMQGDQKHDHGDGSSAGTALENRDGGGDKATFPSAGDAQDEEGDACP